MNDRLPDPAPTGTPDPFRDRPTACVGGGSLADAWTERALESLGRLADIGTELAETLRPAPAPAEAAPAPKRGSDPSLRYARVSRSVRLCWALGARLAKDTAAAKDEARAKAAERAAQAAAEAAREERLRPVRRRDAILGTVAEALHERETPETEAAEVLDALEEWLVEDEGERKLAAKPLAEVVAMIYEDLERPFEPEVWATETRTIEEAAAERQVAPAAAAPTPAAEPAEPGPPAIAAGLDPPEAPA